MVSNLPDLCSALIARLDARAAERGWQAAVSPELLRDSESLNGIDQLIATLRPDTRQPEPRDRSHLPAFQRAFRLAPTPFSLLFCGLEADRPEASYGEALRWTGLVRADIEPWRRSDLHLFLIGPSGSREEGSWRGLRSRLETDERFCRKFVWLPSVKPDNPEIDDFLDRTFLAQPWKAGPAEPRSLDVLARLLEEPQGAGGLTPDEAKLWIKELAAVDATGGQQLAERLYSILRNAR